MDSPTKSYYKGVKMRPRAKILPITARDEEDIDLDFDLRKRPKRVARKRTSLKQEVIGLIEGHGTQDQSKSKTPRSSSNSVVTHDMNDVVVVDDDSKSSVEVVPSPDVVQETLPTNPLPSSEESSLSSDNEDDDEAITLESDAEEKMKLMPSCSTQVVKEMISPGLRIQHKGVIKRLKVAKQDSFRTILTQVRQLFSLEPDSRICLERADGLKMRLESTPASLDNFNFMTDVLHIGFISSTSQEVQQPSDVIEEEECPVGFIDIRIREKIKMPHADCSKCITSCGTCSKSRFITSQVSGGKKRKEVYHKGRILEDNPFQGFLQSIINKIFEEKGIDERSDERSLLQFKFIFDGEDLMMTQKPVDHEMESGSLIDLSISDTRMCGERTCGCNSSRQRPGKRGRRGSRNPENNPGNEASIIDTVMSVITGRF